MAINEQVRTPSILEQGNAVLSFRKRDSLLPTNCSNDCRVKRKERCQKQREREIPRHGGKSKGRNFVSVQTLTAPVEKSDRMERRGTEPKVVPALYLYLILWLHALGWRTWLKTQIVPSA